jgi:hypothetical protein
MKNHIKQISNILDWTLSRQGKNNVENVSMRLKCPPLQKIGLTAYKLGSFDPLFVYVHVFRIL